MKLKVLVCKPVIELPLQEHRPSSSQLDSVDPSGLQAQSCSRGSIYSISFELCTHVASLFDECTMELHDINSDKNAAVFLC